MNTAFAGSIRCACSVQLIHACAVISDTGCSVEAPNSSNLQGHMCCRVDPGVCDKSRIARSPVIATPNLAAGCSGILGECMKSAASARHNLYKKKKRKVSRKTWAHGSSVQRRYHCQHARSWLPDSHFFTAPSGEFPFSLALTGVWLAGWAPWTCRGRRAGQGWLCSCGFFSSAPSQSFPRKSVHGGPGSMLWKG